MSAIDDSAKARIQEDLERVRRCRDMLLTDKVMIELKVCNPDDPDVAESASVTIMREMGVSDAIRSRAEGLLKLLENMLVEDLRSRD